MKYVRQEQQPQQPQQPHKKPQQPEGSPAFISIFPSGKEDEMLQRHNDDKELMRRIRYKESRFDPSAESPAGAKGVAQFMSSTWIDLEDRGIIERGGTPLSPTDAIEAQERYWTYLQERPWINQEGLSVLNRNVRAAIAYNWGEGHALKFLNAIKAKGIDIASDNFDWLEELPLETRDYVKKVVLGTNEKFEKEYREAGEEKYLPLQK